MEKWSKEREWRQMKFKYKTDNQHRSTTYTLKGEEILT